MSSSRPSGMPAPARRSIFVLAVLVFVALISLVVGWIGPYQITPDERWIKNGAILLIVMALLALLAVAAGALTMLVAGGWAIMRKEPNPFGSLSAAQSRALRNNAAVTVLIALIIAGLAAIPFVFRIPGQLPGTRAWFAAEFSALGILLVGATFGFLFGLPHYNDVVVVTPNAPGAGGNAAATAAGSTTVGTSAAATTPNGRSSGPLFSPSTNLEKVAGQLVTFFSGLAFASLLTIPQYIYMFSKFFETGIHGSGAALVGAGFITFFGPLGFITAYVVTRTIGAQAFARSDSELIGITAVITNRHPMLPDVQQEDNADLSDPDRMAIVVTASVPFAELDSIDDFRTWGRAHALLGDYKGALQAFDRAYRLNPTDARIVLDYATALYQDPDWTDPEYVLRKARDAEALESPASSASLRARTKNLQIATMLYVPGRYIDAVIAANDFLRSDLPRVHTIRLYRACGLGQLLWAYADANRLKIAGPGWNAVMEVIRFDASVVAELDEVVCRQLRMVIDPNGRQYPADCDLQFAALHDAQLTKIAKLPAPPPPPDPACKPTLADVPNPAPPGAPDWEATVTAWVKTFP